MRVLMRLVDALPTHSTSDSQNDCSLSSPTKPPQSQHRQQHHLFDTYPSPPPTQHLAMMSFRLRPCDLQNAFQFPCNVVAVAAPVAPVAAAFGVAVAVVDVVAIFMTLLLSDVCTHPHTHICTHTHTRRACFLWCIISKSLPGNVTCEWI